MPSYVRGLLAFPPNPKPEIGSHTPPGFICSVWKFLSKIHSRINPPHDDPPNNFHNQNLTG
jgi:hypothetical protein